MVGSGDGEETPGGLLSPLFMLVSKALVTGLRTEKLGSNSPATGAFLLNKCSVFLDGRRLGIG